MNAAAARSDRSSSKRTRAWLRDSLVAGIVVSVPLYVSFWVINRLVLQVDGILGLLPERLVPSGLLDIPGLGFAVTIAAILIIGTMLRGFVGRKLVGLLEVLIRRIPLLGTLYFATRQLLEQVFSSRAQQFQKVVLVEFPRKGSWCLAFVTARTWSGIEGLVGERMISIFVPTTPNPTSGFFVMVPDGDLIALDMTVEEAFKAIMSSGIVIPGDRAAVRDVDIQTMTLDAPKVVIE